MTETDAGKAAGSGSGSAALLVLALLLLSFLSFAGCAGRAVNAFPEPAGSGESAEIIRSAAGGPVLMSFVAYPLRPGVPPDGVRAAILQSIGRLECSAASFFWTEQAQAGEWLEEEFIRRTEQGMPRRVLLLGHGLGATAASEFARDLLFRDGNVEIVLLLTVDAVKSGRISGGAAAAGSALVGRLSGVSTNLTSYDAAPTPDGTRLWAHINYYQNRTAAYHGTAMPAAENHILDDATGLLNHANADDFALPMLTADVKAALERSLR